MFNFNNKQYKFQTSFASQLKVIIPSEFDQYKALASIENLKAIFPQDIDPDSQPDLLYIAAAGYVGGMINLNDDGVDKDTAISLAASFKNKYINLEHNRGNVIGNLIGYGFSEYGSNKIIPNETISQASAPFNVVLSGYLWKSIEPKICDLIVEASDESSTKFGWVNFSWEILFNDYNIVVGSRDIYNSKIITPDNEKEFNYYDKFLKANKGNGTTDKGEHVYRLIIGDAIPTGIGIVSNPAATVKGVFALTENENNNDNALETEQKDLSKSGEIVKEIKEIKDVVESEKQEILVAASSNNSNNLDDKSNNNSQKKENISSFEKLSVNVDKNLNIDSSTKKIKFMTIKKISDITDENLKEATASNIQQLIADAINQESVRFGKELDNKDKEAKTVQAQLDAVKAEQAASVKKLEDLQKNLDAEKEARANEKIQSDFNLRMAELNDTYEISEKGARVVAKAIRGLSDEQYTEWLDGFEVFAAKKKKAPPVDPAEPDEDDKAKAGDEEDMASKSKSKKSKASLVEAELDKIKSDGKKQQIPNGSSSQDKTLAEKFSAAFGELIPTKE